MQQNDSLVNGQAEHSYNGVMFDVSAKPPHEVVLTSVRVGAQSPAARVLSF